MRGILLVLLAGAVSASAALAAPPRRRAPAPPPASAAKAGPVETAHRRTPYVGAISADAKTGEILFSDSADAEAYPASVTKLMTALLVLEDVKAGRYGLSTRVTATPEVNSTARTTPRSRSPPTRTARTPRSSPG